jgi:hypothetical protein
VQERGGAKLSKTAQPWKRLHLKGSEFRPYPVRVLLMRLYGDYSFKLSARLIGSEVS